MVRKSIRAVTRGYQTARMITGSKGLGKSYTVVDEVKKEIALAYDNGKVLKHQVITGGVKDAISFYATLCDYNDPNTILILDDINTILTNKDCKELLRAAVTNTPERLNAFLGSNKVVRGMRGTYLNKIKFKSKILVITNIPKTKIDPAIISRTSPIEIQATIPELFEWVGKNLENVTSTEIPFEWKLEVYNFIKNELKVSKLKHFDFRAMQDSIMWFASCVTTDEEGRLHIDESWKSYVHTILC
jgi:hypothetical protein